MNGKDLILSIGGVPLAAAKSCTLDISQSFISVASPYAGRWANSLPERVEWTVGAECLLARPEAAGALIDTLTSGKAVYIRFYDMSLGILREGRAYIECLRLSGNVGSLAKYSVQLRGINSLYEYDVDEERTVSIPEDGSTAGTSTTVINDRMFDFTGMKVVPILVLLDANKKELSKDAIIPSAESKSYSFTFYDTHGVDTVYICNKMSNSMHRVGIHIDTYGVEDMYHNPNTRKVLHFAAQVTETTIPRTIRVTIDNLTITQN